MTPISRMLQLPVRTRLYQLGVAWVLGGLAFGGMIGMTSCTPSPTKRLDSSDEVTEPDDPDSPDDSPSDSTSPPSDETDISEQRRDTTTDTAPDSPDDPSDDTSSTSDGRDVPEIQGPTLKIAAWNIKTPSTASTRTQYIAQTARALQVDIVALQELGPNPPIEQIFPSDQYQTYISNQGEDQKQRVGFAIARDLTSRVTRNADYTPLAVQPGQRRGIDLTLQFENRSLRILGVHLNAGCQKGEGPEEECRLLEQQADELKDWVERRERNNEDYLILGDFNRVYDSSSAFWTTLESADRNGMFIATRGESPDCLGGTFDQFIDHLVFDGDVQDWLQISSLRDLTYEQVLSRDPNYESVSDHCPVYVEVAEK